jgi:hypothetical protein
VLTRTWSIASILVTFWLHETRYTALPSWCMSNAEEIAVQYSGSRSDHLNPFACEPELLLRLAREDYHTVSGRGTGNG